MPVARAHFDNCRDLVTLFIQFFKDVLNRSCQSWPGTKGQDEHANFNFLFETFLLFKSPVFPKAGTRGGRYYGLCW